MKRIAAQSGISETQAYNYFGTREQLLVELARREFAKIRAARQIDIDSTTEHYARITRTTRTYLREIGQRRLAPDPVEQPRGPFVAAPGTPQTATNDLRSHAQGLVELYGISRALALGCTPVLTTLCLRAGKLIADKRIDLGRREALPVDRGQGITQHHRCRQARHRASVAPVARSRSAIDRSVARVSARVPDGTPCVRTPPGWR